MTNRKHSLKKYVAILIFIVIFVMQCIGLNTNLVTCSAEVEADSTVSNNFVTDERGQDSDLDYSKETISFTTDKLNTQDQIENNNTSEEKNIDSDSADSNESIDNGADDTKQNENTENKMENNNSEENSDDIEKNDSGKEASDDKNNENSDINNPTEDTNAANTEALEKPISENEEELENFITGFDIQDLKGNSIINDGAVFNRYQVIKLIYDFEIPKNTKAKDFLMTIDECILIKQDMVTDLTIDNEKIGQARFNTDHTVNVQFNDNTFTSDLKGRFYI